MSEDQQVTARVVTNRVSELKYEELLMDGGALNSLRRTIRVEDYTLAVIITFDPPPTVDAGAVFTTEWMVTTAPRPKRWWEFWR